MISWRSAALRNDLALPSFWRYSGSKRSTGIWEFSTAGLWKDPQRKWPWRRRGKPTTSAGRCCHTAHLVRTEWSHSSWRCEWMGPGSVSPCFSALSTSRHLPAPKNKQTQLGFRAFGELQPAPPDATTAQACSAKHLPLLFHRIWLLCRRRCKS